MIYDSWYTINQTINQPTIQGFCFELDVLLSPHSANWQVLENTPTASLQSSNTPSFK